jgi:hypothetical protein
MNMSIANGTRRKLRGFVLDRTTGTPAKDVVVKATSEVDDGIFVNLGLLVSDVAGYVSFDVSQYLGAFTPRPKHLWVEAVADPGSRRDVASDLSKPSTSYEFLLTVNSNLATSRRGRVGLPSIQNPDPLDWDLSPHSFVAKTDATIGEDGCASPQPASFAVRDFQFARVVRVSKATDERIGGDDISAVDPKRPITSIDVPQKLETAFVLEFSQRWYPVGHSIGQLLYSLPLAPCESVNLAVIDWAREDQLLRQDNVTASESLLHNQRRDRTIDETVNSTLQENQDGWSLLGGGAHADSNSAAADLTSVVGFPLRLASAAANLFSLGGGVAHTSGTRNLTADSLQSLHDNIVQQTSVIRSLSSTVIVQSTQRESNVVQTRMVTNHNHCHALTMQYFEVLRHFKVVTSYEQRRRVVLIPYGLFAFDRTGALRFKTILENVLLEQELRPCFDAVLRLEIGSDAYDTSNALPTPPAATHADYFSGTQSLTVAANAIKVTGLLIGPGSSVQVAATGEGIRFKYDLGGGSGPGGQPQVAQLPFPGQGLHEYALLAQVGYDFYEVGTGATFTAKNGGPLRFQFNDWKLDDNSGSATVELAVALPDVPPPPTAPIAPPKPFANSPKTDAVLERALLQHLNSNLGFYNRAVWLLQDPTERRLLLAESLRSRPDILDAIDDTPLAFSGSYLAYGLNVAEDLEQQRASDDMANPTEHSIVSLPTHGIFGEAMLGSCNACEVRDVTRFWNWEESPCAPPPSIEGIRPGPLGQATTATPAALPGPVVQITQPAPAPDPVGLAAALRVLGTSNIFRDLSGLQDVSRLLDRLASGAVTSVGEAQSLARQAQTSLQSHEGAAAASGGSAQRQQTPAERYDNLQVAQHAARAAAELGLAGDAQQRAFEAVLGMNDGPGTIQTAGIRSEGIGDSDNWVDLITFKPTQQLLDELKSRGLEWQRIEDGYGDVNLDGYVLELNRLPDDPGTGVQFTAESLFDYVRTNFASILIRYKSLPGPSLVAYEAADEVRWDSPAPLGAVLKFRIDARPLAASIPFQFPLSGLPIPEFGLVQCSELVTNQADLSGTQADWHWNFVTVKGGGIVGYHPVSGTRQFGVRRVDQSLFWYLRAADRATTFLDYAAGPLLFSGAEAYWTGFFANLVAFIKTNGGDATIGPMYSQRHNWSLVRTYLFGNKPITL